MNRILPILFNTEMVRAILDGRKTVTRRLIKKSQCDGLYKVEPTDWDLECLKEPWHSMSYQEFIKSSYTPPYQPGDILYVRETWYKDPYRYLYRANHSKKEKFYCNGEEIEMKWHPSIHMPKEAARIFLKVTDVRVERLQDMSDDDCEKEGLENFCKKCSALFSNCDTCLNDEGIREDFKELWNSTIKTSDIDRYGWNANPWVWVIEFEQTDKPEEK